MNFVLGLKKKYPVCRQAFYLSYGISRHYLNTICQDVKEGKESTAKKFDDRSNPLHSMQPALQKSMAEIQEALEVDLNPDQAAATKMPNSPQALECWAWMKYYFELVGDFEPNSNNEIHLEPCTVADIYKTYQRDQLRSNNSDFLQYPRFAQIWVDCFP